MIVYEPLWKTMKEKKVSQYLLIKTYGISCGQLDRLKKNQYVYSVQPFRIPKTVGLCRERREIFFVF